MDTGSDSSPQSEEELRALYLAWMCGAKLEYTFHQRDWELVRPYTVNKDSWDLFKQHANDVYRFRKKQQSREELAPLFLAWLAGAAVQYYSHMSDTWITLELANYTKAYQSPTLDGTFCTWVKAGHPIRLKPLDE